jgi:hypothetical protein
VARHDERKRIAPERLPDIARQAALAQLNGNLAVGAGRAARNGARDRVDATVEVRHAVQVERDRGEIGLLAAQQRDDAVDRALHIRRRRRFARLRTSP